LRSAMRKIVDDLPVMPVVTIERGCNERSLCVVCNGVYISPETCLEHACLRVFAGTYPTHDWQNAARNVVIANPANLPLADRYTLDTQEAVPEIRQQRGLPRQRQRPVRLVSACDCPLR